MIVCLFGSVVIIVLVCVGIVGLDMLFIFFKLDVRILCRWGCCFVCCGWLGVGVCYVG